MGRNRKKVIAACKKANIKLVDYKYLTETVMKYKVACGVIACPTCGTVSMGIIYEKCPVCNTPYFAKHESNIS